MAARPELRQEPGSGVFADGLLRRQPVLDRQQALYGYELALQSADERTRAAALICSVYAELGIASALGKSRSFLRVDADLLLDDAIEALPAPAVVIELALTGDPDTRIIERCRTLRERGYALALADYAGLDERCAPLLSLVDVVAINVGPRDDAALQELAGPLARLPLKLLAKGVQTPTQMQRCREIGFALFQGNYYAQAELVSRRHLSASQTTLIALINLAASDAETLLIEEAIKHDPALSVKLLRIVNSVAYGFSRPIGSLRDAITVLGRRQLRRWLHLLLMTPAGADADASRSPLLQLAALRGRMMELLVERVSAGHGRQKLADQAFITGLMSMLPAALGLPMNEIFEQIALEREVRAALATRAGTLGKTLALLDAFDAEDGDTCDALLAAFATPALTRTALNQCLVESLRWVNDYGQ